MTSADEIPAGAVQTAIDGVYDLIALGRLRPGQPIRQEALAEEFGLSRQPVREALRMLASEGLLTYRRNAGYCARELSTAELAQAYRLRQFMEDEILCSLGPVSSERVDRLRAINREILAARRDLGAVRRLNTAFHFELFALSELRLFVQELRRIWQLTSVYRAIYGSDPAALDRIVAEHDAICDALAAGDAARLVALHNQHRGGTLTAVGNFLAEAESAGLVRADC